MKYTLFIAFGNDGTIEAAADRDTLQERWEENNDDQPDAVQELQIDRNASTALVVPVGEVEITAGTPQGVVGARRRELLDIVLGLTASYNAQRIATEPNVAADIATAAIAIQNKLDAAS